MSIFFRTLLFLMLFFSVNSANAEKWYQVELVVFATDNSAALEQEQWPLLPKLKYPDRQGFLVYPEVVALEKLKPAQTVTVDEFGRIVIDLGQQPSLDQEPIQDTLQAFYVLPDEQRTLNQEVSALTHSGQRELLFHQSWIQPVTNKQTALPIVLDNSGDTDTWPRLQGTVTLYLSRYIHLNANLWLNTYGNYLEHPTWKMPAPPIGPKSIIIKESDNYEPPVSGTALLRGEHETEEVDYAPVYPWRHAIALQQNRRMRSGEVHYLDNPAFGVIAKVTPIEVVELEADIEELDETLSDEPSVE